MPITIQRESTEYVFLGLTGAVPATGVEMAFLAAGARPTGGDWETAVLIDDSGHALWTEAQDAGVTGAYFAARLIGSFGGNTVTLTAGDYQVWVRVTDTTEQPVKIAPVVLTVA